MPWRSLSATEAKVVLALEEARQSDVSLDDVERLAGVRRGFARKLAHGLLAKGWFERLGGGRYLLNATARGPDAVPETDPLRLGSRLASPYYFGYATAAELWGLLLRPGRTYYIVAPRRPTVRIIGPSTFRLVHAEPERIFGLTTVARRGERLRVSDLERTVLDCLERPDLAGGFPGAVGILSRASGRLSERRLAAYLRRWGNESLGRRLGYLLETLARGSPTRRKVSVSSSVSAPTPWVPLAPASRYGRTGTRDGRWHVVRNLPDTELLAEVERR